MKITNKTILIVLFILLASLLFTSLVSAQPQTLYMPSTAEYGVKFYAPVSGNYKFTIIGGAWNPWPEGDPTEKGWLAWAHIYKNRDVEYEPDPNYPPWRPVVPDFTVGDQTYQPTYEEAETIGKGLFVDIPLNKDDYVVFLAPDGLGWHYDNRGGVYISITIAEPPVINIIDAKMVSPNELGLGVSVTYPESSSKEAARKITFEATINGKFVKKTIPVTQYTTPGVKFETVDINGNLNPSTPLRIDLIAEGVPRFTDDITFTISATADYEGGMPSQASTKNVKILLPVVVLHGYIHPDGYPMPWYKGGNFLTYELAYKSFGEFLNDNGYNKEKEWGSNDPYYLELKKLGYSTNKYVTLWDPEDPKVVGYTHPMKATPIVIKNDVVSILSRVYSFSYANKVNFVGHSTGGLVARYYAYLEPNKVNKVITVGTPHEGIIRFYLEVFSQKIDTRQEAEKMSIIKGTKDTQNIMPWFVPKWDAIIPPNTIPINPYFENTFNYPTQNTVRYYYIYAVNHDTPKNINIKNENMWYRVDKINNGPGDGYVFEDSAGDKYGEYNQNIGRYPLNTIQEHGFLLNDISVKNQILQNLKN